MLLASRLCGRKSRATDVFQHRPANMIKVDKSKDQYTIINTLKIDNRLVVTDNRCERSIYCTGVEASPVGVAYATLVLLYDYDSISAGGCGKKVAHETLSVDSVEHVCCMCEG